MRGLLDSEFVERLLFAAIVIGILLAGYAALQYVICRIGLRATWRHRSTTAAAR